MTRALWILAVLASSGTAAQAQGWAEKMFTSGVNHNFGTVARGAQLTYSFPVTNPFAVPMEFTEVKSGCGCVTAYASKRTLGPRESGTIEVRMDGTRFLGFKTVAVTVTVGPKYISSAKLQVTATSRTDVVFNPGQVAFGNVAAGEATKRTVDVEYAGALDWRVSLAELKELPYEVTLDENHRRPGQVSYRLSVTLKKDTPPGHLQHHITLKTNDPATPTVTVLVEGQVVSAMTVTPSNLSLGVVRPTEALTRRVVVKGTSPFLVTSVKADQAGVELAEPLPSKPANLQFLTLKLTPDAAGAFRRKVSIQTSAQSAPLTLDIDGLAVR